jgi:hypothetical protein
MGATCCTSQPSDKQLEITNNTHTEDNENHSLNKYDTNSVDLKKTNHVSAETLNINPSIENIPNGSQNEHKESKLETIEEKEFDPKDRYKSPSPNKMASEAQAQAVKQED